MIFAWLSHINLVTDVSPFALKAMLLHVFPRFVPSFPCSLFPVFFSSLLFSSVFYLLSSVFALLVSISFLLFSSTLFFLSLLLFYIFIISPFSLPSSFFSPLSSLSSLFFLSSCDDWKREATGLQRRIVSRFQCMRMIFAWYSHGFRIRRL